MLLSGIGEPAILKHAGIDLKLALPGIGKNLQDHLWTGAGNLSNVATSNNELKPINRIKGLLKYMVFNNGPLCNSPVETTTFIKTNPALKTPDIQFHFIPFHIGDNYQTDIYDINTFPTTNGFAVMSVLLHPESRGEITIRSADPFGPPVIRPDFLKEEKDRTTLLTGLKIAMKLIDAKAFRSVSPAGINHPTRDATDEALMIHIRKSLETLYHPVGTCKMGNDPMAVVNDRLQVHGVNGLRVIDASIMPTIISGNTNAACIMIGEKGAELVKADL